MINKITEVYKQTEYTPYDLNLEEWYHAKKASDNVCIERYADENNLTPDEKQDSSKLWCSALCGMFLTKIGVLNKNTAWTLLAPKHFSKKYEDLEFNENYSFGDEIEIENTF
jgi:hypothetical protein